MKIERQPNKETARFKKQNKNRPSKSYTSMTVKGSINKLKRKEQYENNI